MSLSFDTHTIKPAEGLQSSGETGGKASNSENDDSEHENEPRPEPVTSVPDTYESCITPPNLSQLQREEHLHHQFFYDEADIAAMREHSPTGSGPSDMNTTKGQYATSTISSSDEDALAEPETAYQNTFRVETDSDSESYMAGLSGRMGCQYSAQCTPGTAPQHVSTDTEPGQSAHIGLLPDYVSQDQGYTQHVAPDMAPHLPQYQSQEGHFSPTAQDEIQGKNQEKPQPPNPMPTDCDDSDADFWREDHISSNANTPPSSETLVTVDCCEPPICPDRPPDSQIATHSTGPQETGTKGRMPDSTKKTAPNTDTAGPAQAQTHVTHTEPVETQQSKSINDAGAEGNDARSGDDSGQPNEPSLRKMQGSQYESAVDANGYTQYSYATSEPNTCSFCLFGMVGHDLIWLYTTLHHEYIPV